MTDPSDVARALGRRRFAGLSREEIRKHQSAAAKALWEGMTEAERKAFSKRRAAKRKRNKR